MSTIPTPVVSEIIVTTNPLVTVLYPAYNVDWMEPTLEEPEHEEDAAIIAAFEDLPVAEPKDYADVELEDAEDCQCDECLGIYYDDRDDGYSDDGGDWWWNDGGGYADW